MGKMNKILSEERKQDSALDAFLKDEATHGETEREAKALEEHAAKHAEARVKKR